MAVPRIFCVSVQLSVVCAPTALPPMRTGSNPFFRSFLKISFCCHVDSCPAEILYSSSGSLLIFSALKQGIPPFLLKQICVRVSNNDILW